MPIHFAVKKERQKADCNITDTIKYYNKTNSNLYTGADVMDEREICGGNLMRISAAVKSNLFLAAAIVLTASAALAFGRADEDITQICMFAYAGTVAAVLYTMRSYVSKGEYRKLRSDTVGIIMIEAVWCFITAGALLYAVSLILATLVPVSNILKNLSGVATVMSAVTRVVSLATAGGVPVSAGAKVAALIRSLAEGYGYETAGVILNIAVWTMIVCLFIGMLIRVASGILLVCSANALRKAFDDPEGIADLSVTAKYLTVAGIGTAVCSGMPGGGIALILAGRALGRAVGGNDKETKGDPESDTEVSGGPLQ